MENYMRDAMFKAYDLVESSEDEERITYEDFLRLCLILRKN